MIMGILSRLMGNASEVELKKVEKEFNKIIVEGEEVESGYKIVRDLVIFTNKRMILIDKQGVTGKKTEYHSVPYKFITHFSIESAGHADLDAELKVWISGSGDPITKEFKFGDEIYKVQKAIAEHIMDTWD
jgi:hypothetical protein